MIGRDPRGASFFAAVIAGVIIGWLIGLHIRHAQKKELERTR